MSEEFLLLNPGPVPVSDDVREAMDAPMVSHRSAEFEEVYARVQSGLEYVFERSTLSGEAASDGTALPLNGTATLGMEAAVANLVDPGDTVVAAVNGKFGRRFARIADRYCSVRRVEVPWGESIDPATVAGAVDDDVTAVTLVHNETSTGLRNPVAEIGEIAADHDAHFIVDGVTSVGGDVFRPDDWGVDVAVTDAQKALGAPPGISAVYVSEGTWEDIDGDRAPFYADLDWHRRKAESDQTPFSSAVPLFRAMATALEELREEGMPDRIRRHHHYAETVRESMRALGLELFPEAEKPTDLSNTVVAVSVPEGVDAEEFHRGLTDREVSVAGGQAHLGGEIFRISTMGALAPGDLRRGVRAVAEAMADAGADVDVRGALSVFDV